VLPGVVARLLLTVREVAHSVTTEVLVKVNRHVKLCLGLQLALGSDSLNQLDEEVKNFGIVHALNDFSVHFR
jgi:hypothetical protein